MIKKMLCRILLGTNVSLNIKCTKFGMCAAAQRKKKKVIKLYEKQTNIKKKRIFVTDSWNDILIMLADKF